MTKVGVRDLKLHASKIVQTVEEEQKTYEITMDAETIAVLEPVERKVDRAVLEDIWKERRQLVKEFGENWNGTLTVPEAVSQQRR